MPLKFLTLIGLFAILEIAQPLRAADPLILDPIEYDVALAKAEFDALDEKYTHSQNQLKDLQSQIKRLQNDIAKRAAQNERLRKINPAHPTIAKNETSINQLRKQIPILQRRLPHLERAILPLHSQRNEALKRCETVQRNLDRAKDHLHRLAVDLAEAAKEFAYDRGAIDGEREGLNLGAESGRRLGEELGVYNTKVRAIEFGRRSGSQEGTSTGASEAINLAYQTGEADAWEERGYADGYSSTNKNPDPESNTYREAYETGRLQAENDAYAQYLVGKRKADAFYTSQGLNEQAGSGHTYNENAQPWVSLAKQVRRIEGLTLRSVPSESRKRSKLPIYDIPEHLRVINVDDSLEPPEIVVDFQTHIFEPRNFPFVRAPNQSLHNFFERKYRSYYERVSRDEYEHSYALHFEDSFYRSAEKAIQHYSDPQRYTALAEETENAAFDYYFESARAEAFNRDYPSLYQQVREKAYRAAETDSPEYEKAYQIGTYNALVETGSEDGYAENIHKFQKAEETRGYADREHYYKTNAVFENINFTLKDENDDGVFAINESFSLSVDLDNFGLATQGENQAQLRLRILEGDANTTVSNSLLQPVPPQSSDSQKNVLSGKINSNAYEKQSIQIRAEFIDFGRIIHSQTFRFIVEYPLELSALDHPYRLFSNESNKTLAVLRNPNSRSTPAELSIRLHDEDGRLLLTKRYPSLNPNDSAQLDLEYVLDRATEFTRQKITLEATSLGVVQFRRKLPPSLVSKRHTADSGLLVLIQNLESFDLLPLKNRLQRQGRTFDLFEVEQERAAVSAQLLANYSNGYVFADLGRNPNTNTVQHLQEHFRNGGSIFVATPNISRSDTLQDVLHRLGLKTVEKPSTQNLKGLSVLEGTRFRNEFTANSRLSLQNPQKGVISYPLLRSDKRRGFGGPLILAARNIHPVNLNTFSVATFSMDELPPLGLAALVSEVSVADLSISSLLLRLAQSQSETQAAFRAKQVRVRLLESHTLAAKLRDRAHKASALLVYQRQLESFLDFAQDNSGDPTLRIHLREIATELSRKRHSQANRSSLKALTRELR